MSDGKLRAYYWEIFTALAEITDLVDTDHPDCILPAEDEVEYTGALNACLVFKDGSRLVVQSWLDATAAVVENNYAYVYLDAQGNRIFQYDDAPHHPELLTHPHHVHKGRKPRKGRDKALSLDIPQVDFLTVLSKSLSLNPF